MVDVKIFEDEFKQLVETYSEAASIIDAAMDEFFDGALSIKENKFLVGDSADRLHEFIALAKEHMTGELDHILREHREKAIDFLDEIEEKDDASLSGGS